MRSKISNSVQVSNAEGVLIQQALGNLAVNILQLLEQHVV